MGFSGDCLCIKNDYTFDRIENLKVGDILFNPNKKVGSKIIDIKEKYSTEGYVIKTNNFFEFNIDENTLLKTSNLNIEEAGIFFNEPIFKKPNDLNLVTFLLMHKLNIKENEDFENLYLYSKLIKKGKKNKNYIIFANFYEKAKKYTNNIQHLNSFEIGKNENIKNIYLTLKKEPSWINVLNKKPNQRFLEKDLFFISSTNFEYFLKEYLKENAYQYLDLNNFRIYSQSKTIITQMLYLFTNHLELVPNVEQIKKELWTYENVKQSSKKNIFTISIHNEFKKPILKNNNYYQEIKKIEKNNRNIKYYEIITENNEEFIVYNVITKGVG